MHTDHPRDDGPLIPDARKRWLVIIAVWSGIALFFCGQDLMRFAMFDDPVQAWYLRSEIAYWWLWIPLTPIALYAARRFWITRQDRWRTIAIHCAIALAVGLMHELLNLGLITLTHDINLVTPPNDTFGLRELRAVPVRVLTGFYKYWALIGVYYAFVYARRARLQQVQAAQLQTRLAQAELQALRMQLHPHFLFNTLHAVSMLNFSDVDAANRMLVQLSDLLRMSLEHSGKQHITLREELDFLRKYLEIEQTRFHDRLRVQYDVDPNLLDAQVPNLILQPLVENAIRHGVSKLATPGLVEVSAFHRNGRITLRVCDNGPGVTVDWSADTHARIGLSTTIERLKQLYGSDQEFTIEPRVDGGTCAQVLIPLATTESLHMERKSERV
jgi:two-component system, LytTR family, sensor kinase